MMTRRLGDSGVVDRATRRVRRRGADDLAARRLADGRIHGPLRRRLRRAHRTGRDGGQGDAAAARRHRDLHRLPGQGDQHRRRGADPVRRPVLRRSPRSRLGDLPRPVLLPLVLLAGMVGGGALGGDPRRAQGVPRRQRDPLDDHAQHRRRAGRHVPPARPADRPGAGGDAARASRRPNGCRRTPTCRSSSAAPACTSAWSIAVGMAVAGLGVPLAVEPRVSRPRRRCRS